MKKFLVAMGVAAFAFVGCGDDSSSSGPNDEPGVESSSSSSDKVIEPAEVMSSSSEKAKSSSSDTQSDAEQSSSSEKSGKSSCSTDDASSSSVKSSSDILSSSEESGPSSSYVVLATPCKTETEDNCEYGTVLDDRDGQTYKTVKIGDQVWMAENLNYADSAKTPSLKRKSWCYNNEAKNCDVAGRLYTWAAAIDSVKLANDTDNPQDCGNGRECGLTGKVQGICPSGWHLPSNEEWKALFTAVGGQLNAGKVLKSLTGWYSNGNGTDAFGFSALPAGDRYYSGGFDYDGYHAYFWSATEDNSGYAYSMFLYYYSELAYLGDGSKNYGFSVRCVKD